MDKISEITDGISMPKRTDIKSILLIGSSPIVIGRACAGNR